MSSLVSGKTTVVKYQKLEIICNQGTITSYRDGKSSLDDTVVTQEIFKDAKKYSPGANCKNLTPSAGA